MSESEVDVLDILHEMLVTDRAFYGTLRFMDGGSRSQIIAAHMRNHNQMLAIIRAYMLTPATTNMVLNIPIGTMDASGNFFGRVPIGTMDASGNFFDRVPIGTMDASGNFFDPVPIVPSAQQIQTATETNVPVSNETCAICQDVMNSATRIRHCGHVFHAQCITQWFTMNARCPICRHDIRSLRITVQQDSNESSSLYSDTE